MPIAGRPEALLAAADALTRAAEGLEATAGDLEPALRTAVAGWRGAAAARADERFREDLDALRRASQACRAIAPVLRAHADVLARAQRDGAEGEQLATVDVETGARVVEGAEQALALAGEDAARLVREAAALLLEPVDAERGDILDGLRKAGGDLADELASTLSGALDHVNPFSERFGAAWSQTGAAVTAIATTNPMTTLGAVVDGVATPIAESYRTGGVDEAAGRGAGAIAAALLGGKGLTKLGHLAPEAPPASIGELPAMRRAPGGGLRGHEDLGGHTLDVRKAHVGASDQGLLERLRNEGGRHPVSSFPTRLAAERAVHDNVRANASAIEDWLRDPTRTRPARFDWDHGQVVGRSAPRDAASVDDVVDVSRSRVVLKKDPGAPLGYYILTSFPEP